ncbi:hypothetical protein L9Z73_03530 [Pseudomonas sp. TNT11]|uniref:Uncharacterized protein n=1 Tax=Pseudomonas emilianonis TaxID=2915812 RepID=A0ABT0ECT9_9PSED|nr:MULTISPECIES: hypothetical protein [Pseudomonas]MCK1783465.1 hypothetical protein [Pseudomonas emilianonis]
MTDKMREEFEREWGQVDAEQGVHFIPELNTYGSDLYAQHGYAQMKSSAWFYFQKGWQESREALVIELPEDFTSVGSPNMRMLVAHHREIVGLLVQSIEAAGVKVKS